MMLAYLGPETMLPVTSVLAGVLGFVMMFGRKAFHLVLGLFRKKSATTAPTTRARGHRPTTSRAAVEPRVDADSSESADTVVS